LTTEVLRVKHGPRNFSDGEPIEAVETEKSRILMHELEKDWWVLAVC